MLVVNWGSWAKLLHRKHCDLNLLDNLVVIFEGREMQLN